MVPSKLRAKVVAERIEWVRRMLTQIKSLPLESYDTFSSDSRNVASAESYLRRALEALLDLGRHILAKGFGVGVAEYKRIAQELIRASILTNEDAERLRILAGYRNRMVHFYQEISDQELYEICVKDLSDIEQLLEVMLRWINEHPHMIDQTL